MVGSRRALTLMELVVAVVVVSVVVAGTTSAIAGALRAASTSELRQSVMSRADLVARRIAEDAASVVRDGDLYFVLVMLEDGGGRGREVDELLMFAQPRSQARYEAAGADFAASARSEGAEYEVHYRLAPSSAAGGAGGEELAEGATGVVWRRLDPQPDDAVDGGGVAFPVAGGIESLSIEAHDGARWLEDWDSDRDGIPHAIRVRVTAADRDPRARSAAGSWVRATAVRVAAIDRVPSPYVTIAPDERAEEATEAAAAAAEGNGS